MYVKLLSLVERLED